MPQATQCDSCGRPAVVRIEMAALCYYCKESYLEQMRTSGQRPPHVEIIDKKVSTK